MQTLYHSVKDFQNTLLRNLISKEEKETMAKKFIQSAIKHPGKLHRELGVKEGEKIPAKKMAKALHSKNPTIKKEAVLAKTLKGMHKK